MISRWSGSLTWISLLILFVGGLIGVGRTYPKEVQIVPLWIGVPTLILLVVLWIGEITALARHRNDATGKRQRKEQKVGSAAAQLSSEFTEWRPVIVVIGWVFLYFAVVFFLGFALASPFFIAAFLIRKAQMKGPAAVILAVAATVLVYALMTGLIASDLWCGAIPTIIPGILGGAIVPPF